MDETDCQITYFQGIPRHGKTGKFHQINNTSPQQLHRRNNQLFSWDDVFWKDASKKGPRSVTSTTSFEEVESLCLSKRSSDSMGSSQRQWNRVTGSGQSGLSRNGVSPSRRLASRQSSVTSSSTSSVFSYDSPSTNVPTRQSQRFTDGLLQSLEFINSRGSLDLAEKIFLENLLKRVLDYDAQIPMPTETSSSSSLNQFFQAQNQPYQSPNLRTSATNPYHSQSVLSNNLGNGGNIQKSNEQKNSNTETSTHQSKANFESKRRGDLILPDEDNTSSETNKHSRSNKSKHDTQNRRISNSSNDGTVSSKLLTTDSQSRTSISSTGMDSGFPKEATQFNTLSQQAYHPNLATYLPANSFVQRGSFERTVTPPDPYAFNQPYTTSHAERVLMGLGFSSTEGFLPERFLRDWYDKISKAQMAAMAEMKERESFDNLLENISRSVSRKPSLTNISADFAGVHYSQANVHQRSDSPVQEEQATVTLPSSSESLRLERLNEYVASFYKNSSPGDDVKGRRSKQFASSRQNSLPLFLEAFSEVDNGKKSRKPRVDPHDMEARLEIFLAELLANKKIHASDSGSDSFSSLSERKINNSDLYYTQYSSVNKKRNTHHTSTTKSDGSPRHNRNQNNDKYGGYEESNKESKDRSYPKNKDNSNTSPGSYSQNQKASPVRQSAVDNSFIVSHEGKTSRPSINDEPKPFDNTTSSKRSEYSQRKHIEGRSQKRPNKTESVQSIDGLEVADIMQNQTNEDNKNKEDVEGGQVTTRNPALKLVEPAMVSIVLEDVDQDPAEASFDYPSGSFERTLLGIPSSRRSSTSLSPIPQSPVTVIEVSLDNQQDSLDTEGTGSSKDTDEDSNCMNSTVPPLDEPKAQQSRFSRKGSLSPKAERLKRSRSGNVTVNKEFMVTNDSIDSAGGPPQRRLSLEVPLVPELQQAIDKHKMRKIHDLNKSSDDQMKEETQSTSCSRAPLRDADETRLELAHVDSVQTENQQPIQYTSNNTRNGNADNNTTTNRSTNSLELPEFSEDGCDYAYNITKPRSGYVQQHSNQIGDFKETGDNTPTSLGMQKRVSEFKIGFPGSKESTPESFKSAFRDARRNHKELSPGSLTGFGSDTDQIEISQRQGNLKPTLIARKMISENETTSNIDNSNAIPNFSSSYDHHSAVGVSHPWQFKRTEGQMLRKFNDSPSYYKTTDELKYPPGFDSSVYYFACDRESQCDMPNWISEIKCNISANHSDKFTQTGIPKFEISCQTTEAFAYIDSPDEQVVSVQRHARTKAVNTVLCLIGKEHDTEMNIVNLSEEGFSERMISNLNIVDETLELIDAELLSIRKREFERLTYLPSLDSENQVFHCEKPTCISCATEHSTDEVHDEFLLKRNARLRKADLGNECRARVYAPSSWADATTGVGTSQLVQSSNVVESNQRLSVQKNARALKATKFHVPYAEYKLTHDLNEISNNVSAPIPSNHLQERKGSRVEVLSFNSSDDNNEQFSNNGTGGSSRHSQKRRRQKRKERKVNNQGTHLHKLGLMSSTENMSTEASVTKFNKSVTSDSSNCDTEENMQVNWVTPSSITCSKRTSCLASDGSNEEADDLLCKEHSSVASSRVNSSPTQDVQHKVLHHIQQDYSHAKLSRLRYQSSQRTSSSSFEIESDFMTASQFGIMPTNTLQNRYRDIPEINPVEYSLVHVNDHCGDVQEQSLLCLDTAEMASHINISIAVNPISSSEHERKHVTYEDVTETLYAQETPLTDKNNLNGNTLKEFTTVNLKEDISDLLNNLSGKADSTAFDSAQSCAQMNTSMPLARIAIPEIVISRTDSSDSLQVPRSPDHHLQKAALPSSSGSSSSSMSCPVLPYKASESNCDDAKADAVDTLCLSETVTKHIMEHEEVDAHSHKHTSSVNDVIMAEIRLAYLTDSEKTDSTFETYADGRHLNYMVCTHLGFKDRNVRLNCPPQPEFDAHNDSEFSNALCLESVSSPACGNFEPNQAVFEFDFLTLGHQFRSSCSSGRSFPQSLDASTNKSIAGSDSSQDVDDMDVLIEESRHMRHSSSSSYSDPVLDISDSFSNASLSSVGSRRVVSDKSECQICKSNVNLDHDSESEELSPARGRARVEPSDVYSDSPRSAASDKKTAGDYAITNNFRSSSKETSEETKGSKHKLNVTIPADISNGVTDIQKETTKEVTKGTQDKYELMLSILQRQNEGNPNNASHGSEVCLKDVQHSGENIYKQKSSNRYINDVDGSEEAAHVDYSYGTPLEMDSSKDNSSCLKVGSDNEDKDDMRCVPSTRVWQFGYTQDKCYPLYANSVSKVSSSTVSENDSRESNNMGTSNTDGMLKTVLSNIKNAPKTGDLMGRELKSCVETGFNTNHDIQTETNNSGSEHSRHEDPRIDMAARQAYLMRHYPSIAPDQPKVDMTSATEINADSDAPSYQYWQASSESSSVTFPLSEISEGETSDENSTNEVTENEMLQSPSVSMSLTNTCFEDDSNLEKSSSTVASLEVSRKSPVLKQVPFDPPYNKKRDISRENDSESIRSKTSFGAPDLQKTIPIPGLLTLSFNNSNIMPSNVRFANTPLEHNFNGTKDYTSTDTIADSFVHTHEEIQHIPDIPAAMDFTVDKYHSRNSSHETRTLETQYDVFGNITHKTTDSYIRRRTYYDSPYVSPRELITDNVPGNKLDNKSYLSLAELSIADYRKHKETSPDSLLTNLRPVNADTAANQHESPVNKTPLGNTIPEELVTNHNFKRRILTNLGEDQTSADTNIRDEYRITYHVDEGIDNKSRHDNYVVVLDSSNRICDTTDSSERNDDKSESPCNIITNIANDETFSLNYKLENSSRGDKWGNYVSGDTGIFNIGNLDTSLIGDFHNSFNDNNGVSSNGYSDNSIRENSNDDLRKSCTNDNVASSNGDKEKRRQNLRKKLLKMFTRDTPKEVDLNSDNTIECVRNNMVDTDICDQLASYVPRNVSSVPQTIRTMSPTVSSMSGSDNSKTIVHLKQEARLKYLLGGCIDGFGVETHSSVSDESVTTSELPTVVSETDFFGATTYRNPAAHGIESSICSQDSQYTSIGNIDSCISKVEVLPGNKYNTLDERMTLMLNSENGNAFEEIHSTAETLKKQSYDSSVTRNVKVTTIFSNSVADIPKSLLISDPSSCVGEKQDVLTEGVDSSGYYKSLTQCCQTAEHNVSRSTHAIARNSLSKLRSMDSPLSLHQHIEVSSSTESNDEDMDVVSALKSCGDYDIRIMDMALGRCISLDSDDDRPRAIEDYAGNRLRSYVGATAQVTSIDNAVGNCRARSSSPASVDISDFSNHNTKTVSLAECSAEHMALFTVAHDEDEGPREQPNDSELDVSLYDPFRRFSFDMMSLEHHTTNAEFGTEIAGKRDSRWEISETRSEPGDYKQYMEKTSERQLRLSSLGRAKTSARFLSPSSAEHQTTREINIQSKETCTKSFDASHPELNYLDFLPQMSQQKSVITVLPRRQHNIEIVLSSPEVTNAESAILGTIKDRLTHQGSSVQYELCDQQMVLKHTPLRQGGEFPHMITENDGHTSSENINIHPRKPQHPACQELHSLDIQGTKTSLSSQGLDDVTTPQELNTPAPQCQDDVTARELDSFLPEGQDDVTAQELDALIPQEFDEVTTQELDDLIAQANNNVTIRKLQPECIKQVHTQFSQEEQDSSHLHIITNQDATFETGKNRTRSHTSYDAGHLDQLPASLEDLHQSENETWSESSYIKSLSVTSRDSGFDSHGSPVDVAYKVQEHKY